MVDSTSTDMEVGKAKNVLSRASGTYRKAEFNETLELAKEALAIAEGMPPGEAHDTIRDSAYKRLVECCDRLNRIDEGFAQIQRWLEGCNRMIGRVDALALKARLSYRKGEFDAALKIIDEGISLAQSSSYTNGLATLTRFRADTLWLRGEAERALSVALQALSIYERLDDLEGRARTLNTISIIHIMMGNFFKSIKFGLRAITVLEALNDRNGLRVIYSNVGESYQQIYAMQTALYYHEQALKLSSEHPEADLLRNLGVDLVAVGRVEEGLAYLLRAMDDSRLTGDKDTHMQVLASMADVVFALNRTEEARTLAEELLQQAKQVQAVRHIVRASLILGYCSRSTGADIAAQEYFNEAFINAQRAADKGLIWQSHAALAELLEKSKPELAAVHGNIASEMLTAVYLSIEEPELQEIFRAAPSVAKVLDRYGLRR